MLGRRPQFVYLSVEAFRKRTSQQKLEYVQALKDYLEAPIREVAARHSQYTEH